MVKRGLTPKQKQLLDYIEKCIHSNGYAPTMQEMAKQFKISIPAIQGLLKELIYKGWVSHIEGKARDYVINL